MADDQTTEIVTSWHCPECGHCHTPNGCVGDPTPSDLWAGVSVSICDCDEPYRSGLSADGSPS
ncbi:MAG: hypothetical protein JWO15_3879 [Sphingomonadales bacterium]|nr:hypothetical protein [Sphingomonadales bacterium]